MDHLETARLNLAQEIFVSLTRNFKFAAIVGMIQKDPKQLETALNTAASFSCQAANALIHVYQEGSKSDG